MDQWGWEPCQCTLAHRLSTGRTVGKTDERLHVEQFALSVFYKTLPGMYSVVGFQ